MMHFKTLEKTKIKPNSKQEERKKLQIPGLKVENWSTKWHYKGSIKQWAEPLKWWMAVTNP